MYFIVAVILLTQQYMNSREQIEQGYHFVITRLEVNGSGSLKIFNGNRNEISFGVIVSAPILMLKSGILL